MLKLRWRAIAEGRHAVSTMFPIGERVIWLSGLGADFGLQDRFPQVEAEIVRVFHGRVLIRMLERQSGQHAERVVERWVDPSTLRKRPA